MSAVIEKNHFVLTFDARLVHRIRWVARNAILVVNRDRNDEHLERVTADPSTLQLIVEKLLDVNPRITVD